MVRRDWVHCNASSPLRALWSFHFTRRSSHSTRQHQRSTVEHFICTCWKELREKLEDKDATCTSRPPLHDWTDLAPESDRDVLSSSLRPTQEEPIDLGNTIDQWPIPVCWWSGCLIRITPTKPNHPRSISRGRNEACAHLTFSFQRLHDDN
jgi:hypothetical protein